MDDISTPPQPPEPSTPNYRRMTMSITEEDSALLNDLVKGADQLDWMKPTRSSILRALVRTASDGLKKNGDIIPPVGECLNFFMPYHLKQIAAEAMTPGPAKGITPPKRLR